MQKFYLLLAFVFSHLIFGQVGVNTIYPTGIFYIDGGTNANTNDTPSAIDQRDDFFVNERGNIGIGTTSLQSNTRLTIRPNVDDRHGIYFNYVASSVENTAYAIDINSNNRYIRGFNYYNSSTGSGVFYGTGSVLSSTKIVSGFTAYRNSSGLSYGIYGVTGTNASYDQNNATWALFSQGRAEISRDSSPSHIDGVDLQVRNTTSGATNPATIMLRQSNALVTNNRVLGRLDFGDNHVTTPQARIEIARDAAGGEGDLPTRMTFSTTADGSSTLTERMRITNDGKVGIGSTDPKSTLDLAGNLSVKHITLNGSNTGGMGTPIDISDGVYLSINPLQNDDTFRLPNPTTVPGRIYILRNINNLLTAKIIAYPNNNGGGAVNLFREVNTTGSSSLYMYNDNFRTIIAISDGLNWTIIGPGNF